MGAPRLAGMTIINKPEPGTVSVQDKNESSERDIKQLKARSAA